MANTAGNTVSGMTGNGALTSPMVGTGLGAVGAGLGLVGALQNPSNPSNDVAAASDAYKLYNAGSTIAAGAAQSAAGGVGGAFGGVTASGAAVPEGAAAADAFGGGGAATTGGAAAAGGAASIAAIAGPAMFAYIAGQLVTGGLGDAAHGPAMTFNPMTGLQQNAEGKLPSGNSVASVGNLGIGEGNDPTKGSDQLYQLQPGGKASNNTAYKWVGGAATNEALTAYSEYESSLKPSSKGVNLGGFGGVVNSNDPAADLKLANAAFGDVFDTTGGAKGWGENEAAFQAAAIRLMSDENANGGKGLGMSMGQGA